MRHWLAVAGIVAALAGPALAQEGNHAGYYYPDPQSREEYVSRARTMVDADRLRYVQTLLNSLDGRVRGLVRIGT